jgi:catechol 2,3-dioxygenase-like lactoylglutathione lyase family enzyme
MIRGIKFVNIPVTNQDAALAFYTEKLGFEILSDQPFSPEQRWLELGIPGAETRLVLFTTDANRESIGKPQPLTFWTAKIEETYQELQRRGVSFRKAPTVQPWGSFAIFEDQDGNQFVLSTK